GLSLHYHDPHAVFPAIRSFASVHVSAFIHPTIILEHSAYVKSTGCHANSSTITVGFTRRSAWATAVQDWTKHPQFLLVAFADSCGLGRQSGERSVHLVQNFTASEMTLEIVGTMLEIPLSEAIHPDRDVTIDIDTFDVHDSQPSFPLPSSSRVRRAGDAEMGGGSNDDDNAGSDDPTTGSQTSDSTTPTEEQPDPTPSSNDNTAGSNDPAAGSQTSDPTTPSEEQLDPTPPPDDNTDSEDPAAGSQTSDPTTSSEEPQDPTPSSDYSTDDNTDDDPVPGNQTSDSPSASTDEEPGPISTATFPSTGEPDDSQLEPVSIPQNLPNSTALDSATDLTFDQAYNIFEESLAFLAANETGFIMPEEEMDDPFWLAQLFPGSDEQELQRRGCFSETRGLKNILKNCLIDPVSFINGW
ncbi:hypothetical protein C8R47DRAFT_110516, partial [Mycena vitilis]